MVSLKGKIKGCGHSTLSQLDRETAYKQVQFPLADCLADTVPGTEEISHAVTHRLCAEAKIAQPAKENVPLRAASAKAKLIQRCSQGLHAEGLFPGPTGLFQPRPR